MAGPHSVVLIGGPGPRRTHIATALGIQAVALHRKKVRFFVTADVVSAIAQNKGHESGWATRRQAVEDEVAARQIHGPVVGSMSREIQRMRVDLPEAASPMVTMSSASRT